MRLNNLQIPGKDGVWDLRVGNGKILEVTVAAGPQPARAAGRESPNAVGAAPSSGGADKKSRGADEVSEPQLSFEGALVFPGLINSHDHLDFNLFPLLGNRIYKNYTDWGSDIHTNNTAAMRSVLQVPQELRTLWGIYKNLLNGFTTVVNHGDKLATDAALITIFQDCHCLHSVGFERNWRWKLNRAFGGSQPVVLHVGEGTDPAAGREIDRLIRWNLFKRPLIGIHGVAMTERQAPAFRALVWCPASNLFLLDRTAPIDRLKERVPIVFGTDSTLTAVWNCWTQIRLGRSLDLATDRELLEMLTTVPAATWGLRDRGALAADLVADLVIARPKPGLHGMDAFYGLDPEDILLILHHGNIRVFDSSLKESLSPLGNASGDFRQTGPGGKFVQGDLPGLMQEIRGYYPEMRFPAIP